MLVLSIGQNNMEHLLQALIDKPSEANAIMALCALVTSILSIYLTIRTLQIQKRHNFQSVKPIAWVSVADFEDRISVTLQNNGVGPMIIKKVDIKTEKETKASLIDWMPAGHSWDMFIAVFEDRCRIRRSQFVFGASTYDASIKRRPTRS
jgi:hypothetical protein